jgi:hypothetical protein
MTLEQASLISQIVSAAAVIASLIFVGVQLKQAAASRIQWQKGRLDPEHWHTIERQAISFGHMPGLKAAWKVLGHWYSPDFCAWFEGLDGSGAPSAGANSPY